MFVPFLFLFPFHSSPVLLPHHPPPPLQRTDRDGRPCLYHKMYNKRGELHAPTHALQPSPGPPRGRAAAGPGPSVAAGAGACSGRAPRHVTPLGGETSESVRAMPPHRCLQCRSLILEHWPVLAFPPPSGIIHLSAAPPELARRPPPRLQATTPVGTPSAAGPGAGSGLRLQPRTRGEDLPGETQGGEDLPGETPSKVHHRGETG